MPTTVAKNSIERFFQLADRAEGLIERLESLIPHHIKAPDWSASVAFRWRKRSGRAQLEPVLHVANIAQQQLCNIDLQMSKVSQNTKQFVEGRPANNVLLTGARGTGKSSLVRAMLNEYAAQGLRLIEVDKVDLLDLQDIVDLIAGRPERFILFCDDLSFEDGEPGYKALKSVLDGSIAAPANNLLIYATSNRRHLMPESMRDNLDTKHTEDGEIHPGEAVEEKISLSERFGLWVSFHTFTQEEYLQAVGQWLRHYGGDDAAIATAGPMALRWTLERGSRSGRVALQFARHWAGLNPHSYNNGQR
jgi:hypothetical protein